MIKRLKSFGLAVIFSLFLSSAWAVISDNYEPTKDLANGITTEFTFNWPAINTDYIEVWSEDETTGVQTELTTGFTVAENASETGGTVTFSSAPDDVYIIIKRVTPLSQPSAYSTSRGFPAATLEASFDKITAITQDLQEQINRAILIPLGSEESSPDYAELLSSATEATEAVLEDCEEQVVLAAAQVSLAAAQVSLASGYATNASNSASEAEGYATALNLPTITGNANKVLSVNSGATATEYLYSVLDEDDMSSDSASAISTQQSIKAYIDNQLGALQYFYDRGDPASVDYSIGSFTADGSWRNLDLSSIVPDGAKAVLLRVTIAGGAGRYAQFREDGNSNAINVSRCTIQGSESLNLDVWVSLSSGRVIEYFVTAAAPTTLNVTVSGWIK